MFHNLKCCVFESPLDAVFQDLIAVGYGQFEFSNQKEGMLMCWSLKNPEVR